ncbi:DUF6599 family protein [Candidatus Latescibacterota bacterium]
MKKVIIVLIAFITTGCLFPVSQNLRGIIQTHKDYTLSNIGESFDALSIKKHIPADAGIFVEFGVDTCLVAEFHRGSERYNVEIYSFLTPAGALGTYFITDLPGSQPVDLGYHARMSTTAVQFIKGHYIISVFPSKNGSIDGAFELASGFERRIEGGSIKPDLFLTLPTTNIVENSKLYFKGHRGFETRFSADLGKALTVEYALNGTTAKYVVGHTIVDLIRLRFPGRPETLEGVDSYLKIRKDRPILHSQENLMYNTVIEPDRSEVYIAELGDVLYIMLGAAPDRKGQEFFEYILRGGK